MMGSIEESYLRTRVVSTDWTSLNEESGHVGRRRVSGPLVGVIGVFGRCSEEHYGCDEIEFESEPG